MARHLLNTCNAEVHSDMYLECKGIIYKHTKVGGLEKYLSVFSL